MLWIIRLEKGTRSTKANRFRPRRVFSSHRAYQCLSWPRFPYYPRMDKGAKREIWHSFAFLVVQASPLLVSPPHPPNTTSEMEFQGAEKKQSRSGSKQPNLCVSVPQRSVCLPDGCRVFVHPSSLITIMSPKRSVRAGFLCLLLCVHVVSFVRKCN